MTEPPYGSLGRQEFHMGDEQRERVRDCLNKTGITLRQDAFDRLAANIEKSITTFLAAALEPTFRSKHDALRDLWRLAHEDDPPIGVIRARIQGLPNEVMDYIDNRASHVVPRLEAQHAAAACAEREPSSDPEPRRRLRRQPSPRATTDREHWMRRGGFQAWARVAPAGLLCRAVAVVTAQGAQAVPGRGRGGSKRSSARLEPRILGVVRGAREEKPQGGRPPADARQSLVMHLALNWTTCTGRMPEAGRSDHTGFGDLAHAVFQWLGLSPDEAEYSLRAYWEKVQSIRSRRMEEDTE